LKCVNFLVAVGACITLETAVGHIEVYAHQGAGQGATSLNGYSIQVRSNAAMCREGRAIQRVAQPPNSQQVIHQNKR
jgi:hypothetical protein